MKESRQSFDDKILALCGPLVQAGKWGEAVSLLEQVVLRGGSHPQVLRLLGRGYEEQGRNGDALAAYKALCSAYPGDCETASRYCSLLIRAGKVGQAARVGVEQLYASGKGTECTGLLRILERIVPRDGAVEMPEFLGIGAMKAATSWLHVALSLHPEVFVPEVKELHHFDSVLAPRMHLYSEMFRGRSENSRGEITPGYSTLNDSAVRRIHELRPDLRILFLLRNPVDRAWSHARMNLATQQGRAPEAVSVSEYMEHFHSDASMKRGDYPAILRRWENTFGPRQMFIGFHEDVLHRPHELLKDIFRFLGVRDDLPPHLFPLDRKVHEGRSFDMPAECRDVLDRLYAPILEELHERFGEKVRLWRN